MLSYELINYYHRGEGPTRWAAKFNIRKAYDSVIWEIVVLFLNVWGY